VKPTNPCELSAGGKGGQPKANQIDCLPGGVKVRGQPQGGALVVSKKQRHLTPIKRDPGWMPRFAARRFQ
jgi:hypothetical protein